MKPPYDHIRRIVFAAALSISVWPGGVPKPSGAAEPTEQGYVARFQDGQWRRAETLIDWGKSDVKPRIGDRVLLDDPPVKWFRAPDPTDGLPGGPGVYFVNGDFLPGRVIRAVQPTDSPFAAWQPSLSVELLQSAVPPGVEERRRMTVDLRFVERVVWEPEPFHSSSGASPGSATGGTYRRRNDLPATYTAIRWRADGVTLLTGDGLRKVDFDDLAELHLAVGDRWPTYYDELAVVSPALSSALWQYQCRSGLRVTTSEERLEPVTFGDVNRLSDWWQVVQPAWAAEPLWIRFRDITTGIRFAPENVPLCRVPPIQVVHEPVFGTAFSWRNDRNVLGNLLISGREPFGWGIGVHGRTTLSYELPATARTFTTEFGIDDVAGSGGCLSFTVRLRGRSDPLFSSETLIGSEKYGSTGPLPISTDDESASLELFVDSQPTSGPAGADLLDIRDFADWLEPVVTLDNDVLATEVAARAASLIPALQGWAILMPDSSPAPIAHQKVSWRRESVAWEAVMTVPAPGVLLSAERTLTPESRFLLVHCYRPPESEQTARLEVQIHQQVLGSFTVPRRDGPLLPEAIIVPLPETEATTADIRLALLPDGDETSVCWRSIRLTSRDPGLLALLDEPEDESSLATVANGLEWIPRESPVNGRALRFDGAEHHLSPIPAQSIRELPELGEYRLLAFSWKSTGAGPIELLLANNGEFFDDETRPELADLPSRVPHELRGLAKRYRYRQGGARNAADARVLSDKLPTDWVNHTVDPYGDFGSLEMTGWKLRQLSPGMLAFDRAYLARTHQDLQRLNDQFWARDHVPDPNSNVLDHAWAVEDIGPLVSRVAPGFAVISAARPIELLKTWGDVEQVLQLRPERKETPVVLRAVSSSTVKQSLVARAAAEPGRQWKLTVVANGDSIHEQTIETPAGEPIRWHDVSVDIPPGPGSWQVIEMRQELINGQGTPFFWGRVALTESSD